VEGDILRHIYRVSDIHVCPSHYEPFGLVAAEAMASGTPVVVSATGGLTDIVAGRDVGRTFRPRDAAGLAEALLELAQDCELRRRLGQAGRRHVRKHFAWPVLANKAASLYAKVAP
jgi:glycosyltransferase involved in cell wall biosynthesis